MFSIASQLAINFGYDNIHHIEYDCELLDKYLILENSKLLETYDSIIYTDSGNEDGMLFGSFKSFKVKSLPDKFKNYDRDFIEIEIKKAQPSRLEYLTKDLFINSGKVLFGPEPSVNRFKRGATFYNRNLHHTLYYSEQDQNLHLFYKSVTNVSELICVIINNSQVIMIEVLPNTWSIRHLGLFDEINHVRIDNSAKIIYQKSFDSQDKELFKIKSYLLKVK
jgi:hypothetical protein